MRTFLIALFATAAMPAAALAQEVLTLDRPETALAAEARVEVAQTESRGGWRGQRGDAGMQARTQRSDDARPARQWNGGDDGQARQRRNWENDGRTRPNRSWNDDGNRGRRFDATPAAQPAPIQPQAAPPVQGAPRVEGRRNWNADAPRTDAGRGDDRTRDWNRDGGGRRDWGRNDNDGRRDWAGRDDRRRDWDRNNDGRRDWNRNDGRRDWSDNRGYDRRWNDGRRDFRQWDRGWRNNSRYDWQRYRSANRYAYRLPRYAAPYGWNYGYRRFSIGAYLFAGLFAQDYWINDPWAYRLPPTDWPYQWVRYHNDALLIDTRSGYVVDSIPDIFWY